MDEEVQIVSASREIAAPPEAVFELIATPAQHAAWDGNDNVAEVVRGDRVLAVGEVFVMRVTNGKVRDNHVVAFEEGRLIAWRPASEGKDPAGHEWRWEVEPVGNGASRVTHTYDWTELTDESRVERARATGEAQLQASLDRLAKVVESAT